MATNLNVYVNNDTQDLPLESTGVIWTLIDVFNDYFIFSQGNDVVKDGEAIPSSSDLNQAGILISDIEQVVPHYFLADADENKIEEIHNAGNKDKRYVFAFSFDGATASEPVLEVWDNGNMNEVESYCLGGDPEAHTEDPSSSWVRGIVTTQVSSGENWVGNRLAGSSDGHFLNLNANGGALTEAKVLYCQLKIVVSANFLHAHAESPTFVVKYTTN